MDRLFRLARLSVCAVVMTLLAAWATACHFRIGPFSCDLDIVLQEAKTGGLMSAGINYGPPPYRDIYKNDPFLRLWAYTEPRGYFEHIRPDHPHIPSEWWPY